MIQGLNDFEEGIPIFGIKLTCILYENEHATADKLRAKAAWIFANDMDLAEAICSLRDEGRRVRVETTRMLVTQEMKFLEEIFRKRVVVKLA